jgi:hypothetical protein
MQQNALIDDWRYANQYSINDLPLEAYILIAGIAYIAFLAAVKAIISFFSPGWLKRLFVVGGMVAIAVILIIISIPNFRKARMGMSVAFTNPGFIKHSARTKAVQIGISNFFEHSQVIS